MLIEATTVIAVEPDFLWVEAVQTSACGSCKAQKGCGQSLLSKFGATPNYLKVARSGGLEGEPFLPGDRVDIGIHESVVVSASLIAYLLPLVFFLVGVTLGHYVFASEGLSILLGLAGLLAGAIAVRFVIQRRNCAAFEPVLMGRHQPLSELVSVVNVIK